MTFCIEQVQVTQPSQVSNVSNKFHASFLSKSLSGRGLPGNAAFWLARSHYEDTSDWEAVIATVQSLFS